jgi:fibronectin type 3 domain-containing protein
MLVAHYLLDNRRMNQCSTTNTGVLFKGDEMKKLINRSWAAVIVLSLMTLGLMLAGCGDDTQVSTPTAPVAPVASAVAGFSQVTVSWNAVSDATSYNIYWGTTTGVTPLTGTKISNAVSPFVQTGLSAVPNSYFYVVTAVNSVGESSPSAQVSATTTSAPTIPAAPTGAAAVGGQNQVTVSWNAVSGATSYNIYWAQTTGVTKLSGTIIANVTSAYVHTGRTAATTYFYIVTAVNSAGEGPASTQASATTNADVLVCGSCHAIPPATGQHDFHVNSRGISCSSCHGTGYSATTVNAATHNQGNGVVNLNSSLGWNATARTCGTPGCHGGGRSW